MKKNEILKLGLILFFITAINGLILGGAHEITKEPIKKQLNKTNENAMIETLPVADSFKKVNISIKSDITEEINEGIKGTEVVGYAIKVAPKGYAGPVELMVGISIEGEVEGIKILSQSETPGLGANSVKKSFTSQYKGKALEPAINVVKTSPSNSNEIQALTGATITSKAVTLGVNEAINVYKAQLKGGIK